MSEQIAAKNVTPLSNLFRRAISNKVEEAREQAQRKENMIELTESIREAYLEWQSALANFEDADCKDMVDYYAYRIKASQIRYEYLLRKAKQAQVQ